VVPTFGGLDRYDKPILVYWCTAASYALNRVNERSARLPANLAGVERAAGGRERPPPFGPGRAPRRLALVVTAHLHLQARACTATW